MSFEIEGHDQTKSPYGPVKLFIDDRQVAGEQYQTQPGFFGLEGVVTVGRDIGRPPSDDYRSPDPFRGGVVEKVIVAIKGPPYSRFGHAGRDGEPTRLSEAGIGAKEGPIIERS